MVGVRSTRRSGTSPVEALKTILAEQVHAQIYRDQIWKRGGRVGTYISRPADAPPWNKPQRDRFLKAYADAYTGDDASKRPAAIRCSRTV